MCHLAKSYNEGHLLSLHTPEKATLQKILKTIGGKAQGLKTEEHYLRKIAKTIEDKCSCIAPDH